MTVGYRMMAVHAHPDDESSKGAGTTARYVSEGVEVMVVSCTGGERGDILNPRLKDDFELRHDMTEFRRREMRRAQQILGVQHTWLGFVDSGLPQGDPLPPLPEGCFAREPLSVTTEALVRVIRSFRPHVVTTYNELGGYPHPDHVMTHKVSVAAFRAAGDPEQFPNAGSPWQPLKLYYDCGLSTQRLVTFHAALLAAGEESPLGPWLARREEMKVLERVATTRVYAADHFETRNAALLAHATQIDPDGWWFALPIDRERELWPTEEFEAALSYVPIVDDEDDLFAGLGGPEAADGLAIQAVGRGLTATYDAIKEA